ncbi:hypothetical protein AEA09_16245 [Lysinibacillus contaminans]|uniref:Insulinase family protein n=1 Tax=Lysinibacillus contaminans TaxID=1293441 RepID=A0ABR5JXU3_9BACI|nr:insulinase family protein [Lysinibacillus contaminans]KOS66791.1 hypothetical protein AEA09_16245 [Lysinibacillus contaminans]
MKKTDFLELLDSSSESYTLSNGLQIFRIKHPNTSMRLVNIQIDFGSRDIKLRSPDGSIKSLPAGTAHFLEHLMFWKDNQNIYEDFFTKNAFINAFTSHLNTNFMFTTLQDNVFENIKFLFTILTQHQVNEVNIIKEKQIIKSEIETANMDYSIKKQYEMLKLLCNGSPVSIYPTGSQIDIESLSSNDIKIAYKTFYRPDNMRIFILGGKEDIDESLLDELGRFKIPEDTTYIKHLNFHKNTITEDIYEKIDNSTGITEYVIGVNLPRLDGEELVKQKIYWEIFTKALFDMESPFIQELQKTSNIFIRNLSVYGHFTEDISFLILTIQGDSPQEFFDSWQSYIINQSENIDNWLRFGKDSFRNNIIFESDYIRKLFDWISTFSDYHCSLSKVNEISKNINISNFDKLLNSFINTKKVHILYT